MIKTLIYIILLCISSTALSKSVELSIRLPSYTGEADVYLTGSSDQLCQWDVKCMKLQVVNNKAKVQVKIPKNGLQLKITNGTWESVGTGLDGNSYENVNIPGDYNNKVFNIKVHHWADQIGRYHSHVLPYEKEDEHGARVENLIVGSSSARMWTTVKQDFNSKTFYSRGVGGAHTEDIEIYKNRLILKHSPKNLLFYLGENDIASNQEPLYVYNKLKKLILDIKPKLDKTKFYCLSIKLSPARDQFSNNFKKLNRLLEESNFCEYVDVYSTMLNDSGELRNDIWLSDNVHMNQKGYKLWTQKIKAQLNL
jgi:lysophospholipase L1-like esterase